jgi:hypothetical protein
MMIFNIENEKKIFCIFCWRLIDFKNSASRFCDLHHPKRENGKEYHSIRRKVLCAVNQKFSEKVNRHSFSKRTYYLDDISIKYRKLSNSPFVINKTINKQKFISWDKRAKLIEEWVEDNYSNSYLEIKKKLANRFHSVEEWFEGALSLLKVDPSLLLNQVNIVSDEDMQIWLLLIIARYESFHNLSKYQPKSGRTKGKLKVTELNVGLRAAIKQAVKDNKRLGIKINRSEIAKRFGVGRGWVSKLMKNMNL